MQQDYLKRQIDQIGIILGRMLSSFLGLKKQGKTQEGIEITSQTLKTELDFSIDKIIAINSDDLISFLVQEKRFNNQNIDKLAEILLLIADDEGLKDKKEALYQRCLTMYQYLEKTDSTFSIDRQFKIERIKNIL